MAITHRGLLFRCFYLFVAIVYYLFLKISNKKDGLIILCYHGVNDLQVNSFKRQLSIIKNRTISLGCIKSAKLKKHNYSICLTFDDALLNLVKNVIPAISSYSIPISIFIPTGSLGESPSWLQGTTHHDKNELILSSEQISNLANNKLILFGSHTVDHYRLSVQKDDEIRYQLRNSANTISNLIGGEVKELALPHGDYNSKVIDLALEEGYDTILTLEPIVISLGDLQTDGVFGRFSVSPDMWFIEYILVVNGAYKWLYSWRKWIHNFLS